MSRDSHSGCNWIFIAEEDVPKTAFKYLGAIGTSEWVVMPFGIKNVGAIYQRAMNYIFQDKIDKFMEVYIDVVVVKCDKVSHLNYLEHTFTRMRKYSLKMNSIKCAFGVKAGKFLWFHYKKIRD